MALEQWHKIRWSSDKEHMAYSSKRETTVFEIQTRGYLCNPRPIKRASFHACELSAQNMQTSNE